MIFFLMNLFLKIDNAIVDQVSDVGNLVFIDEEFNQYYDYFSLRDNYSILGY
ncbi:hypothetical protein SAMN05421796_108167 [Chryseobacterium piscicola]|uniref:Uncharacterized protein n=1 Tax=Chryseobacterium piscicola TaxID=551459 RepID=A0A1N7NMS0_9FLAO|nr:hypothetical protein [Chryseobacterium piscicola]SIS99664.1 hypothetical protein SAMN05421796_108167 [Chryseobacterium piscicola]